MRTLDSPFKGIGFVQLVAGKSLENFAFSFPREQTNFDVHRVERTSFRAGVALGVQRLSRRTGSPTGSSGWNCCSSRLVRK